MEGDSQCLSNRQAPLHPLFVGFHTYSAPLQMPPQAINHAVVLKRNPTLSCDTPPALRGATQAPWYRGAPTHNTLPSPEPCNPVLDCGLAPYLLRKHLCRHFQLVLSGGEVRCLSIVQPDVVALLTVHRCQGTRVSAPASTWFCNTKPSRVTTPYWSSTPVLFSLPTSFFFPWERHWTNDTMLQMWFVKRAGRGEKPTGRCRAPLGTGWHS